MVDCSSPGFRSCGSFVILALGLCSFSYFYGLSIIAGTLRFCFEEEMDVDTGALVFYRFIIQNLPMYTNIAPGIDDQDHFDLEKEFSHSDCLYIVYPRTSPSEMIDISSEHHDRLSRHLLSSYIHLAFCLYHRHRP